jgi:imidazolonepropionase
MTDIDLLIVHASQLCVVPAVNGGPQRGRDLGRLGVITDGALLIRGETIAAVGPSAELRRAYPGEETFDASGFAVLPGFVDPHTHAIWAGDRAAEFEMRQHHVSHHRVNEDVWLQKRLCLL